MLSRLNCSFSSEWHPRTLEELNGEAFTEIKKKNISWYHSVIVTDGLKIVVTLIVLVIEIVACHWWKSRHFTIERWKYMFQLTEVTPSGQIASFHCFLTFSSSECVVLIHTRRCDFTFRIFQVQTFCELLINKR